MPSFFATDFLGTAPSTSATGQNGSVIAQLVKIAINMHFCDFSMIAYFPPEVHLEKKIFLHRNKTISLVLRC